MCSICNIDEIMEMLDWNNSEEVQQKGVELSRNIRSISAFVIPMNPGKSVWENCAKILAERPDEELKPYLSQLLEWLQDLTWPGAFIILDRLKEYKEMEMLVFCVEVCVKRAVACGTWEDLLLLDHISELLDNENLKEVLPEEILETLQKHYHNNGWWDEE